jgi:hypothetical protein
MPTLFMETTNIAPEKTISEIESVLARYGATAISKEYVKGEIEALSFRVQVNGQEIQFRLPRRYKAIEQIFHDRTDRYASESQVDSRKSKARRVAWRQILRWVQAQMALVETKMVKVEEVFLPYIQGPGGQTVYELYQ